MPPIFLATSQSGDNKIRLPSGDLPGVRFSAGQHTSIQMLEMLLPRRKRGRYHHHVIDEDNSLLKPACGSKAPEVGA